MNYTIPLSYNPVDTHKLAEVLRRYEGEHHNTMIRDFEKAIADYTGVKYVLALNSGTAAIHLGLIALGVGVGDEVLVPDFTYVASVNPVLYLGARPGVPVRSGDPASCLAMGIAGARRRLVGRIGRGAGRAVPPLRRGRTASRVELRHSRRRGTSGSWLRHPLPLPQFAIPAEHAPPIWPKRMRFAFLLCDAQPLIPFQHECRQAIAGKNRRTVHLHVVLA